MMSINNGSDSFDRKSIQQNELSSPESDKKDVVGRSLEPSFERLTAPNPYESPTTEEIDASKIKYTPYDRARQTVIFTGALSGVCSILGGALAGSWYYGALGATAFILSLGYDWFVPAALSSYDTQENK